MSSLTIISWKLWIFSLIIEKFETVDFQIGSGNSEIVNFQICWESFETVDVQIPSENF
jgi:hypothetical protein